MKRDAFMRRLCAIHLLFWDAYVEALPMMRQNPKHRGREMPACAEDDPDFFGAYCAGGEL